MVRSYIIALISTTHAWNWGLQGHLGKCSFISARHWRSAWSARLKVNSPGKRKGRKRVRVESGLHVCLRGDYRQRVHHLLDNTTNCPCSFHENPKMYSTMHDYSKGKFASRQLSHFPTKQHTMNQTKRRMNTHKHSRAAYMRGIYPALPVGLIN